MTEDRYQISDIRNRGQKIFCLLIPVLCLLISGCGFQPVYGSRDKGGPVAAELNQVAIASIANREGQMLRNDLIDSMYGKGRPSSPQYKLEVKLRYSVAYLGIQADATSTRALMDTYGDYTLKDAKEKVILKGTAHSVSSYNQLGDQYASLAAHDGALERTINEVSEQIVNRLSLYFAEHTPGDTAVPATMPIEPAQPSATPLPTSTTPQNPAAAPNL